jgi:hypothetical protein
MAKPYRIQNYENSEVNKAASFTHRTRLSDLPFHLHLREQIKEGEEYVPGRVIALLCTLVER